MFYLDLIGFFAGPYANIQNYYNNYFYSNLFDYQLSNSNNYRRTTAPAQNTNFQFLNTPTISLNNWSCTQNNDSLYNFDRYLNFNNYQNNSFKFEYIGRKTPVKENKNTIKTETTSVKTQKSNEPSKVSMIKTVSNAAKTIAPKINRSINNIQKVNKESTQNSQWQYNPALNNEFLNVASKYSNCCESDNSHIKFCNNKGCNKYNYGEWCTDFVSYVTKEAYRNKGKYLPSSFGTHDVEELKNWAISQNKFIRTSNKGQKAQFIKNNIKPGDIFILNENGASHTGFVTKIYDDGSFSTIEGNRNDKVTRYNYSPHYDQLSGFIRMT